MVFAFCRYTVATGFTDKDPMGTLAGYQNATNTQLDSVLASAKGARMGQGLQDMKRNDIMSVISGLDSVEKETDSMLDINTMMVRTLPVVLRFADTAVTTTAS